MGFYNLKQDFTKQDFLGEKTIPLQAIAPGKTYVYPSTMWNATQVTTLLV